MARIKIDYGIDLGTTNSAICRMEKGNPLVIKTDVLKDTMPSCVSVTKKGSIRVGDSAFNTMKSAKRSATKSMQIEDINVYTEFKRTMATDTRYYSSHLERDLTSEELSSEVLKTLKSFVTDESISSVVITVPAKFTVNQKTATLEAANLAGFTRCELLQEPIAAAMAYGLSTEEKDGLWMVFDFGGGTFDVALLKVEDGIMQVFDTEGDNYLGGKNLDYAIVDNLLLPYLQENYAIDSYLEDDEAREIWRDALKTYAEEAKTQLSFKPSEDIISNLGDVGADEEGEDIELDLTLTQEQVFAAMRPYFQKAVDICKALLKRNNLSGDQLSKLILVGGPTHCPLIRQMLKEQITPKVDTSIDPMTAVATGAALYASTVDADMNSVEVEPDTVKLEIGYEATTVETSEWVTVKLGKENELSSVWIELIRSDKAWSSTKVEVNRVGEVIEISLLESRANSFEVVAYDNKGNTVPCFPSEFSVIQGSKVSSAPLPYNIGIAIWDNHRQKAVFKMAKGLEKNKPLPAVGVINGLKTTSELRPGVLADELRIPIYQTDDFAEAEGKTVALYEYVADVLITGDDVEHLIPEDSLVDVTLKVDASEQMRLEVHFLSSDISVDKDLDTSKKQSIAEAKIAVDKGIKDAKRILKKLKAEGISIGDTMDKLSLVEEEAENSTESKMVLQHLKEVLRDIETLESGTEWERLDRNLREEFERLEHAQQTEGDNETEREVESLRSRVEAVIRSKDVRLGREILEEINHLYVRLTLLYQCIGLIQDMNDNFAYTQWKDRGRAKQLINQALELINTNPTVDRIHPIAVLLIQLLPDEEAKRTGGLLK